VLQGRSFTTPDGRYLAYGYNQTSGLGVYLYDANSDTTVCVSCRANGESPEAFTVQAERFVSNQIPSPIDDAGDVFFNTAAALVPTDSNGTQDVYEYNNRLAVVRLISPGDGPYKASVSGVSKDGTNVYFATAQPLVSRDTDFGVDIYDARVGGGLPAQSPPAPQVCAGDDCRPTSTNGSEMSPGGSESLRSQGNLKQKRKAKTHKCPKGRRAVTKHGTTKCVKAHGKKRKHHAKKAKRHAKRGTLNRRQGK
jgi:hypothetical protein